MVLQHERLVCCHIVGLAPIGPTAHSLHAIVGQVLFSDVLAVDGSAPTFIVKCEDVVEDNLGREA